MERIPWIEEHIPIGKENAMSRQMLKTLSGTSDRAMRKLIQEGREAGYIIINDQDGAGYYRTEDIKDIERQYRQDTARAMSILKRRKETRKILKEAGRPV